MSGVVDEVVENEGIVLKSNAAFIQGIFGIAGEKRGDLLLVSSGPGEELTADQITADMKGKILIGGSFQSRCLQESFKCSSCWNCSRRL